MGARWLVVPLMLATACGAESAAGTVDTLSASTTDLMANAPTSITGDVPSSTSAAPPSTTLVPPSTAPPPTEVTTTLGPVTQQVSVEATLPVFDGPAQLWRTPSMPPDPDRLATWARAFGFTDDEIASAVGSRIERDTPDGQVLAIAEPIGRWVFMNGPAGMYALPGSCPTTAVPPAAAQPCADPPPPGVPDPVAAEAQARSLWDALGLDLTGASVTVGGDEYLREVIASDALDGVPAARVRVVIGEGGRVMSASGGLGVPVAAGTVPRVGLDVALDRFARQPFSSGPATTAPASFDGVYRVVGATAGFVSNGGSWLVPTYEVSLADGRTLTLLAIEQSDMPPD